MAIKHTHNCSNCNKDFTWIEFTSEHVNKPGLYDVVDLSRVGETMPKKDGGFSIVAHCGHCGHKNIFDM